MRPRSFSFLTPILAGALLFGAACGSDSTSPPPAPPPNPPAPPPPPPAPAPRTLIAGLTVPVTGGTLKYTNAADPLNGLTLTVPAGAYPSPSQWTITADSGVTVPLPTGFSQVGPVLVVSNGRDYADSVMTLTVPMHLTDDDAVAPFYFDPATSTLEGIPLVDRSDTSATLAARHFSATALAVPGNAALRSGVTATAPSGFGVVQIVWVKTPRVNLVGTFTSSFRPGADDWEFINYGDYVSPGGDCEGMSVSAMYYHYFVKAGGQPQLFHRYDQSITNQWDNVQGIRFAGSVQGDANPQFQVAGSQMSTLITQATARGAKLEDLTATWVLLTLKLNSRPVLMFLKGTIGAHAVVAYAATYNGTRADVSFADPNFPGTARTMVFLSGVLTPVSLQVNARAAPSAFDKAYAMGVTGAVAMAKISARWAEFVQQKAGADRYPPTWRFEVYDNLSATWSTLPDTVKTTDIDLQVRMICPSCPAKTTGGAPDEHHTEIWDAGGTTDLNQSQNQAGTTTYLAVAKANSPFDNGFGFVDAKPFTVVYEPFTVGLVERGLKTDTPGHFFASAGALATPGSKYTWTFSDGSAPTVVQDDSTLIHKFTRIGNFTIGVTLADAAGKAIAKQEVVIYVLHDFTVAIAPDPIRAIVGVPITLTVTFQGRLPSGGLPPGLTYEWDIIDGQNSQRVSTTTPSLVYAFPATGTYEVSVSLIDPAEFSGIPFEFSSTVTATVVQASPAWRLESFTHTSGGGPAPDPLLDDAGPFRDIIAHIEALPGRGLIFLLDQSYAGPPANAFASYFPLVHLQVSSPTESALALDPNGHFGNENFELATQCTPAFAGISVQECQLATLSNSGGLQSGGLSGVAVGTQGGGGGNGSGVNFAAYPTVIFTLNAVKNGPVMSGTIQLTDLLHLAAPGPPTGTRTDTWTFSARLVP